MMHARSRMHACRIGKPNSKRKPIGYWSMSSTEANSEQEKNHRYFIANVRAVLLQSVDLEETQFIVRMRHDSLNLILTTWIVLLD